MNLAVFGYSRGKLIRVASDQRLKYYCVRRQVVDMRGGQSVVDYWWLTLVLQFLVLQRALNSLSSDIQFSVITLS